MFLYRYILSYGLTNLFIAVAAVVLYAYDDADLEWSTVVGWAALLCAVFWTLYFLVVDFEKKK